MLAGGDHPEVGMEVEVTEDGECLLSQGTQTGEGELVQITASLTEVLRRVEAFTQFKRQQVNISNQIEFCSGTQSSDGSCARTSAVCVRRGRRSSHISTVRMQNTTGPTLPPPSPLDQLKRDLQPPEAAMVQRPLHLHSSNLLGLGERVAAIEQYMGVFSEGPTTRDLLHRVRCLEHRLLQLEGQSPEYQRPQIAAKCPPAASLSSVPSLPPGHPARHGYR